MVRKIHIWILTMMIFTLFVGNTAVNAANAYYINTKTATVNVGDEDNRLVLEIKNFPLLSAVTIPLSPCCSTFAIFSFQEVHFGFLVDCDKFLISSTSLLSSSPTFTVGECTLSEY